MTFSKEWSYLISICQNRLGIDIDNQLDNSINWAAFLDFVQKHRIIPPVYEYIIDQNLDEIIPRDIVIKLRHSYLVITQHNLTLTRELLLLDGILKEKNIEYIPYKGIILAQMVFDKLGGRQTADLDILVPINKIDALKEVLSENGYELPKTLDRRLEKKKLLLNCEFSIYKLTNNRKISVDVHWRMANPMLQFNIDFDSLQPYCSKQTLNKTELNFLSYETLYLTTCIHHLGKEKLLHLKQLLDLAMILKKYESNLDWDLMLEIAEKWKVRNLLFYSLKLIDTTFDSNYAKHIKKEIPDFESQIKHHIVDLYNSKGKMPETIMDDFKNGIKLQMQLRDGIGTKIKSIYYHLVTLCTPTTADFKNPEKISTIDWYLSYIKKPWRLIRAHF